MTKPMPADPCNKTTTACPYCGAEEGADCQSATRCSWADDAHDSSCPGCDECLPKIGSYRTAPEDFYAVGSNIKDGTSCDV